MLHTHLFEWYNDKELQRNLYDNDMILRERPIAANVLYHIFFVIFFAKNLLSTRVLLSTRKVINATSHGYETLRLILG